MIRIYSEKYSQNFLDNDSKVQCTKPSIGGVLKARVISFLPPEEQWDATMLSKRGLEDSLMPSEPETDLSECEQEMIGFDIPICNVM